MAPRRTRSDDEPDLGVCPCGDPADDIIRLSGEVKTCKECGHQEQATVEVPACSAHVEQHLSGQLDGRMLMAASSAGKPEVAALILAQPADADAPVVRAVREHGQMVGYERRGGTE